jgi:lysophospholipase L1-like esterase
MSDDSSLSGFFRRHALTISVVVNAALLLSLAVTVVDSGPIGEAKAGVRSALAGTLSGWRNPADAPFRPSPGYSRWTSIYAEVPVQCGDIVIAGDSQVAHVPWHEFFQNPRVKGRGISGDGVYGLRHRMASIAEAQPAALLLFIGGNDIYSAHGPSEVASAYAALLDDLHATSPDTRVIILSTTPMSRSDPNARRWETMRSAYDALLQSVAAERAYAEFVDISTPLSRPDGFLDPAYSPDASHLNGPGYAIVARTLAPMIDTLSASP